MWSFWRVFSKDFKISLISFSCGTFSNRFIFRFFYSRFLSLLLLSRHSLNTSLQSSKFTRKLFLFLLSHFMKLINKLAWVMTDAYNSRRWFNWLLRNFLKPSDLVNDCVNLAKLEICDKIFLFVSCFSLLSFLPRSSSLSALYSWITSSAALFAFVHVMLMSFCTPDGKHLIDLGSEINFILSAQSGEFFLWSRSFAKLRTHWLHSYTLNLEYRVL